MRITESENLHGRPFTVGPEAAALIQPLHDDEIFAATPEEQWVGDFRQEQRYIIPAWKRKGMGLEP